MSETYKCSGVVRWEDRGYGRYADCPKCGTRIAAKNYIEMTTKCGASICKRCKKPKFPFRHCTCDK